MRDEILNLVKRIGGRQNILVLPRIFVDLTGDINSALLLSQLLYWSDRTPDRDGWIYKTHKDWQSELGLNRYFLDKAKARLSQLGVIEVKVKKANGSPTMHFRVNQATLSKTLNTLLQSAEPEPGKSDCQSLANGKDRAWQNEMPDFGKSLTETTTEITAETTRGDDDLSPEQNELFEILERIPHFLHDRPIGKLRELQTDYPNLDYRLEFKKFAEYWSTRKLKRPWLALRNWLERARRGGANSYGNGHSRELPKRYTPPPSYED
jgi:hypothetical protein